jgi:hypothetical protein
MGDRDRNRVADSDFRGRRLDILPLNAFVREVGYSPGPELRTERQPLFELSRRVAAWSISSCRFGRPKDQL